MNQFRINKKKRLKYKKRENIFPGISFKLMGFNDWNLGIHDEMFSW